LTNAAKEIVIEPISSQFGIVVEKLGINAPVVKDVPVIDKTAYLESLKQGVAHASFSGYPDGENSNVYLFAHSSNNFWELGKYSSVFNLIYKLNPGDQINIFYKDKRYLYAVDNKILINDFKVDETVYESIGPTLTLQTCYPTGTSLYRLIVRSSLIGIYDFK
jgi:sortase A